MFFPEETIFASGLLLRKKQQASKLRVSVKAQKQNQ